MNHYRLLGKKGEGTFSEVLLGRHVRSNQEVAIKYLKNKFHSIDAVNSFNEIRALRMLRDHPNIVRLLDVLYDITTGSLALVLELMDMNVYEAIKGRKYYFPELRVGRWMTQLLCAVEFLHGKGLFHRDIKPENLLLHQYETLKLADLGSCKGIDCKQPFTEYISTRWYRAPECLLTDGYYSAGMDIWAIGCVYFEVLSLVPLFPGKNEVDQVNKIHKVMGLPAEDLLKYFKRSSKSNSEIDLWLRKCKVSDEAIEIIKVLLTYDAEQRPTATEALRLPYFDSHRYAVPDDTERPSKGQVPSSDVIQDSSMSETSGSTARYQPRIGPEAHRGYDQRDHATIGGRLMRESDRLLVEADATVTSGFGRQNGMRMEQISETTRLPPIPQRQPQESGHSRAMGIGIDASPYQQRHHRRSNRVYHRTLRVAPGRVQMPALELSNSSPRETNQQGSAASFSHTMGHFALPLSGRMRNIVRAGISDGLLQVQTTPYEENSIYQGYDMRWNFIVNNSICHFWAIDYLLKSERLEIQRSVDSRVIRLESQTYENRTSHNDFNLELLFRCEIERQQACPMRRMRVTTRESFNMVTGALQTTCTHVLRKANWEAGVCRIENMEATIIINNNDGNLASNPCNTIDHALAQRNRGQI
ncbi:cyclin-dependent serine/threonine protein kinase, putative [Perkinsus marinus ATCC 50983]|uniref:Cyclin-dependent serine/threonine protein kinase, putative n=1 Tax=Perkinsus marinus (strain ATCC 50983 / TXsc) TaxID=423536 RepID=C5L9W9_PERM5|nr:cyclin-dependent serine/threonine protein kinase, putative [Perkinsus marinus ATCC 50983]EER06225.1 cyclin-dependent serine/threonine protein kinase, putative [Perkinsus marinus ATCC 50983]|eukprot:XP_002774409.1 cyclin-dependent serine/threonine protein kinase, putative [Perkinsus marinus ATCC 50983]